MNHNRKTSMEKGVKLTGRHGIRYGADTSGFNATDASDFIRKRAYEHFEMRGREPGHELEDWLQAELEIRIRFLI
jgi:hypothetical protein